MKKILLKRKTISVIVILLCIWLIWHLFFGPKDEVKSGPKKAQNIYVELGEAKFGNMREVGLYYGTLSAAQKFSVSPKVGGELKQLLVDIGDKIESGQVLARLDDEQYRLTREQLSHNVKLAEAQQEEARANLRLAKSDFARQESLVLKKITSQSEFETYQNKMAQAEARLNLAESQLSASQSILADADLKLSYTEIIANWPEGGYRWIGERLVDVGDLLSANSPILSVVSLAPLLVEVNVIERDYPKIKIGQEAELRTEAWPGEVFTGKVVRLAPILSTKTRQARVELEVSNADLRLKPGMFTEVLFVFKEIKDVWSVPQDVPFRRSDGFVIFIADPKTFTVEMRSVEMGLIENGQVELTNSPPIKGPIVVLGQHLLEDGQAYSLPGSSPDKAVKKLEQPVEAK